MYTVSPSKGDKFYLHVLLNHVRGPTSWEYLPTLDGISIPTFKQSAQEQDYPSTSSTTETNFTNKLLRDLNGILLFHRKQISDFDLPTLPLHDHEDNVTPRIIQEQLSFHISHQDLDDVGN
ncbi:hypothetical protein Lal_00040079 [Lupinus albus]|nr:hypothetical protein Lal_00040079 [Lupinus albus]